MTKRIMDDATRKKLMGLLPFAPGSHANFTPDEFAGVDSEFRPVFYIRSLTSDALAKFRLEVQKREATDIVYIEALSSGALVGWDNLVDIVSGVEIPYTKEAVAALPERLIMSIFMKVLEYTNGPTEQEKTGLESLPPPTSAQ